MQILIRAKISYEAEIYFRYFDGERTPSVSTNAYILEAFGSRFK